MRSWNGLRTWSKVIRDASSRYAAAPAYVPGMAASFSHGAVRRSRSDCSATVRAAARRSLPRDSRPAFSALRHASHATSMMRCTSSTSCSGVVLHCSSISASSRRARASSSVRASLGSGVRAGGAVRSWDVDGLADELEALLLD